MNKKGFTLVELLAVIAILAILVIIALPNVLKMYNDSKKNSFMTEAQNLAKEVSSKYINESMKENKVTVISNKQNPLDMTGRELEYNFELDSQGKIKNMIVSNGTYCISTNKDYTKITRNDISDKCSYEKLHNIVGTLKNKFYEESGRTNRSLVSSIVFYSDGRTINGAESYDVSEKKDGSIKMYVSQNTENTSLLDLTIVANGKIAFPEDSSELFYFGKQVGCSEYISNLKIIQFDNSIDTSSVTNMHNMFKGCKVTTLDLSGFDTSNVTNMAGMFVYSKATMLDLSGFDTSNVTNMGSMFQNSQATEIKGLNKFYTSNVTDMSAMFRSSKATTGYARTQNDVDKFNNSSGKPSGLTFVVK
jgi:prepilin-type N-terminal cleavage/methylation domain-containing protein